MQRKVVIKENFTEENRVCVKTCGLYIRFKNEDKRQEQLCKSFQSKIYLEYMSLIKPQIPVICEDGQIQRTNQFLFLSIE